MDDISTIKKKSADGKVCAFSGCNISNNEYMLECRKCKGACHFACSKLPAYQIALFLDKSYRRNFQCETCVENIHNDILNNCYSKNGLDENTVTLEKKYEKLEMEVNEKEDIIESLQAAANDIDEQMKAVKSLLEMKQQFNFEPENSNLGASGIRGVGIYYKKELQVTEVEFKSVGLRDHTWIEISSFQRQSILLGCIYRIPSNINGSIGSTNDIIQIITEAYEHNHNLIIAGDFNYKEIDWENYCAPYQYELRFLEALKECYLHQHVTEPTRYRENEQPNLLDLILSTEEGMVKDLEHLQNFK